MMNVYRLRRDGSEVPRLGRVERVLDGDQRHARLLLHDAPGHRGRVVVCRGGFTVNAAPDGAAPAVVVGGDGLVGKLLGDGDAGLQEGVVGQLHVGVCQVNLGVGVTYIGL